MHGLDLIPGEWEQPGKLNVDLLGEPTQHCSLGSDYSYSTETCLGSNPQPLNLLITGKIFSKETDAHCREPVISRSELHTDLHKCKDFSIM